MQKLRVNFFFRIMNLIFIASVIISIILIFISLYLWNFEFEIQTKLSQFKKIVLGIFIVLSSFLSQWIYRRNLKRINPSDQLIVKLQAYQIAVIYRLIILEFTLIITILFFIFTKLWALLIIIIALLVIIISIKPNRKKFISLVKLSEEDRISVLSKDR